MELQVYRPCFRKHENYAFLMLSPRPHEQHLMVD